MPTRTMEVMFFAWMAAAADASWEWRRGAMRSPSTALGVLYGYRCQGSTLRKATLERE